LKHTIVALVAAIGAVGFVRTSHATDNYALFSADNVVGLSIGSQHQHYSEYYGGSIEDGNYGGVQPSYRVYFSALRDWRNITNLYLAGSISYANGSTTYDGNLVNYVTGVQTPYSDTTPTRFVDWNIRVGKGFALNEEESVQLIPYVDYAQHYWDRLNGGGEGDYSEYYRHHVISTGVIAQYALNDKWVFNAEAQFGYLFSATSQAPSLEGTINLGNGYYIQGANGPIKLGNHTTVMAGFGADYAVTYHFHVTANYSWQRYGYGQGVNNDFTEPTSRTIMQKFEVGFALTF
jgi:hypothetical protein